MNVAATAVQRRAGRGRPWRRTPSAAGVQGNSPEVTTVEPTSAPLRVCSWSKRARPGPWHRRAAAAAVSWP